MCLGLIFALLSKEVAIMLPFFIIGISYFLFRQKVTLPKALVIFPSLIAVMFIMFRLNATNTTVSENSLGFVDRILSFIPVYVNYIFRTLTSYELTTNDAVQIWSQMNTSTFAFYISLFGIVATAQYYFAKKDIFIAAGLLWFNLFLVPVSQMVPILHFRADRFHLYTIYWFCTCHGLYLSTLL